MEKATIFILSKDGSYLEEEALDALLEILGRSFEPANMPKLNHILMKAGHESGKPVKNAHNDPTYLLGAIEESEYLPIVVAWYEDETGFPKPKFFVSEAEITRLMDELEKNRDTDAWETAIRVNREIRESEE